MPSKQHAKYFQEWENNEENFNISTNNKWTSKNNVPIFYEPGQHIINLSINDEWEEDITQIQKKMYLSTAISDQITSNPLLRPTSFPIMLSLLSNLITPNFKKSQTCISSSISRKLIFSPHVLMSVMVAINRLVYARRNESYSNDLFIESTCRRRTLTAVSKS